MYSELASVKTEIFDVLATKYGFTKYGFATSVIINLIL